jgi:hypothetical protein
MIYREEEFSVWPARTPATAFIPVAGGSPPPLALAIKEDACHGHFFCGRRIAAAFGFVQGNSFCQKITSLPLRKVHPG